MKSFDNYAKNWANQSHSRNNLAHVYLEKPAMQKKVPDIQGKSILALGSGTGEECAYLLSRGAKRVVGIDKSRGFVAYADKKYPEIEFKRMDFRKLDFPDRSFDFVYSSLALHYVKDWHGVLSEVHRVLRKNGRFLFSTHHPTAWGMAKESRNGVRSTLLGYTRSADKKKIKIFGDCLTVRKINDVWFGELKVQYYNRSISALLSDIRKSKFKLSDLLEPLPQSSVKSKDRHFFNIRQRIPLFIIFELLK